VIADLSGNGRVEVILPRQNRDVLAAVELSNGRWEERWALQLSGPVQSNILVEDLDGDGLLDLVVADRRALHVFSGVRSATCARLPAPAPASIASSRMA